jgi:hypothetical protein
MLCLARLALAGALAAGVVAVGAPAQAKGCRLARRRGGSCSALVLSTWS